MIRHRRVHILAWVRRHVRRRLPFGSVLILLAGCGGSTHLTASQWQQRATAICNSAAAKAGHVIASLQNPASARQVESYLRAVASTTTGMDQKLSALADPPNLVESARTVIDDNEATVRAENLAIDQLPRLSAVNTINDAEIQRIFAPIQATANTGQVRAATSSVPASCVLVP
jgi:hypothetical protein